MATKTSSVLALGRQPREAEASGFWFQDPDKLLAAVIRHAEADPKFAQRVASEIGRWAKNKPSNAAALKDALKAKRSGRAKTPYWQHVMLLHELDMLLKDEKTTQEEALARLGQDHWNRSLETMKTRLSQARKLIKAEDL